MPLSSRHKFFVFTAVWITLGIAVALLLAELVLRAFQLAPSAGVVTVTESEFERIPGIFRPNQRVLDRRLPSLPFTVSIDSLGYRGRDVSRRKPDGELRILAIGDSFTFGDFVEDQETLPAQLEALLSPQCGQKVTVINGGVGGTTIATHAEMVNRGWAISPDLVLLTFTENDVMDLLDPLWFRLARNREVKSRFPVSVAYPVLNNLALWHLALEVRARLRSRMVQNRAGDGAEPAHVAPGRMPSVADSLKTEYAKRLRVLYSSVESHRQRLMLVAYPSHNTVSGRRSNEQLTWLEGIGESMGVPTVNLLPTMRANGREGGALYLLPHDGHPSPAGYLVAAAVVAERLFDAGVCSGSANGGPVTPDGS